jgi:hypothetical protein
MLFARFHRPHESSDSVDFLAVGLAKAVKPDDQFLWHFATGLGLQLYLFQQIIQLCVDLEDRTGFSY